MRNILAEKILCLVMVCLNVFQTIGQELNWNWVGNIGGLNNEYSVTVVTDPFDGSIYATGMFTGSVDLDPGATNFMVDSKGGDDIFLIKMDKNCNFLWAKTIGGTLSEVCGSMTISGFENGNVYLTGYYHGTVDFDPGPDSFFLSSKANADLFILALNKMGEFLWAHSIGGSGNDNGRAIKVAPIKNGDIYVSGAYQSTVDFDPLVPEANLKSAGSYDMFLLCLDYGGNFKWVRSIGGISQDFGTSIIINPSDNHDIFVLGGFSGTVDFSLMAGTTKISSFGPQDIFLAKFNTTGEILWVKTIGGLTSEYGTSIAIDIKSKDLCLSGFFQGTVDFDPGTGIYTKTSTGNQDLFILKLTSEGNFKWVYTAGGPGVESSNSVDIDNSGSGDIFSTGYFQQFVNFKVGQDSVKLNSAGSYDMYLLKLDSSGIFQWVKSSGGVSLETGASVTIGLDSEIVICGDFYSTPLKFDSIIIYNTNSASNTSDIFIAKINASEPTKIKEYSESQIEIYPIPAMTKITFDCNNAGQNCLSLIIYDMNGKLIWQTIIPENSNSLNIDIENFKPAMYFLEVNTPKGKMYRKFIKSN